MLDLVILILAADPSLAECLLTPIAGVAQLIRVATCALDSGRRVIVALPPVQPERWAALAGLPVEIVTVADADQGTAAAIRAGARIAGPCRLMLLPADMPELETTDLVALAALSDTTPDRILRGASSDGVPGNPVTIPGDLVPEMIALNCGDDPRILQAAYPERRLIVALKDQRALTCLQAFKAQLP
jgi:molybdenum cofactor cytidylyltransferase